MEIQYNLLTPYLLAFGAALAPAPLFHLWLHWRCCVRAALPRPDKLLSGPGDSQRERIARLDGKITAAAVWLVSIPVGCIAAFLAPRLTGVTPLVGPDLYVLPGLALVLLLIPLFSLIGACRERRSCLQKLAAELTVGREINLLLRDGFQVFHDVPDDGGNLNHVVVGLSGVFVVESVGRPVPDLGGGLIDAKVIYDGENLFFPPDNAKDGEAVRQARRQAVALERLLADGVGRPVAVRPALALPGWFVERKRPDDLTLLYGQANHYARILRGPTVFSPEQARQIGRVLEARCRGVALDDLAGDGEGARGAS